MHLRIDGRISHSNARMGLGSSDLCLVSFTPVLMPTNWPLLSLTRFGQNQIATK